MGDVHRPLSFTVVEEDPFQTPQRRASSTRHPPPSAPLRADLAIHHELDLVLALLGRLRDLSCAMIPVTGP
eukprot:9974938-Heterocapsa_arctica.AAC.1